MACIHCKCAHKLSAHTACTHTHTRTHTHTHAHTHTRTDTYCMYTQSHTHVHTRTHTHTHTHKHTPILWTAAILRNYIYIGMHAPHWLLCTVMKIIEVDLFILLGYFINLHSFFTIPLGTARSLSLLKQGVILFNLLYDVT